MSIERFLIAVESIAASLTVIAGGAGTPANSPGETKEPKSRTPRTTKADAPTKQESTAAAEPVKQEPAAAAEPVKQEPAPAKPEEPAFDYEKLKKAIIELASAGAPGKEAAMNILTDAGLVRGQKADAAPPAKWPKMYDQAVAALANIKAEEDAGGFA